MYPCTLVQGNEKYPTPEGIERQRWMTTNENRCVCSLVMLNRGEMCSKYIDLGEREVYSGMRFSNSPLGGCLPSYEIHIQIQTQIILSN